jgi:membrane protease YdiL (CAAX protease family)
MLLVVTRDGYSKAGWQSLGLHRAGFRGWGLALLLPLVVLGLSYSLVWGLGLARLVIPDTIEGTPVNFVFPLLLLAFIAKKTITSSLGEELGWRGYFLPRLAAIGARRAMFLSGLLHGVWHLPLIFFTPFYHGDGNRFLVVSLFLAALTIAGAVFGYLRLTTDSVWPCAIAHSAHNMYWFVLSSFTVAASPFAAEYLAGESGLLTTLGYALAATWLLYRLNKRSQPKLSVAAQSA